MKNNTKSQKCYDLVRQFFKDDNKKTINWFHEDNSSLGGTKPINMIKSGRVDKLLTFIRSSLNDNFR